MFARRPRVVDPRRAALLPFALILGALVLLYSASTTIDRLSSLSELRAYDARSLFALIFAPDEREARDVLNTIGQAVPGVLGIVITVVAVIVELASNRYSAQITKLFIRDRLSAAIFTLFVIASVYPLWVASSYQPNFVPRTGFLISLALATLALLSLPPYFVYVFAFVQPPHIIHAIRRSIREATATAAAGVRPAGAVTAGAAADEMLALKVKAQVGVDQIADLARNSIAYGDRALATDTVSAVHDIMIDYFEEKERLPPSWFTIAAEERAANPDYLTLAEDGVADLEVDRVWFEQKVMKQLMVVFSEALNEMREIEILIAIFLRTVALEALRRGDRPAHRLALRFFNTALRSAFSGRDVRTAYNILYQYRGVAEELIRAGNDAEVETICGWLKYYGLLFESTGLGFITETVAHDIYRLLRVALDHRRPNFEALLAVFLEIDHQPDAGASDVHLRGVRKAQSMLAAYAIAHGQREIADRIARDMKSEPPERLRSIRREMRSAERQFWEVTDRGVNFDYLEPELRPALDEFFDQLLTTYTAYSRGPSVT